MRKAALKKRRIKYAIVFTVIAIWLLITIIVYNSSGGDGNKGKAIKPKFDGPDSPFQPTVLPAKKHVVACMGDSLTKGAFSSNESQYSYPAQLAQMLGQPDKYDVLNLGLGMRSMRKSSPLPYVNETVY